MTALCSGGTSGPKAGVAETIVFTTGALASLLNNKGGAWAVIVAPLLGVLTYEATDLCGTDPPADPGMTAADYQHLLKLDDWSAVATAIAKLADLAKIAIWYEMCECKTVGTPAPPVIWTPPVGIPNPTNGTRSPCWSWSANDFPTAYTSGKEPIASFRLYPLPPGTHRTGSYGSGALGFENVVQVARQPNWTDVTISLEYLTRPTGNEFITAELCLFSASDTFVQPIAMTQIGGTTSAFPAAKITSESLAGNTGRDWMALMLIQQNNATMKEVHVTVDAYCGQPGVNGDPCVTDPAVLALLQQIWSLLQLVQRQHVPFAYVPGDVHAGLTGTGIIDVEQLLGYTVELTTIPDYLGVTDESPDTVWSAGTTRWGTPDGWGDRRFITAPETFVPIRGDVTRIGYTLAGGVQATIREHRREASG